LGQAAAGAAGGFPAAAEKKSTPQSGFNKAIRLLRMFDLALCVYFYCASIFKERLFLKKGFHSSSSSRRINIKQFLGRLHL
jgi:hypothetical protein